MKIVNEALPNTELYTIEGFGPKNAVDLYPGEKQVVSYLINPLPIGTYLIKMVAFMNKDQLVAEADLPITIIKENIPDPGTAIPEMMPVSTPSMFPPEIKELQEPLHTFRIHELKEPDLLKFSGILNLPMPDKDCTVVLRLITPSGLATASVNVTIEKRKKRGRVR